MTSSISTTKGAGAKDKKSLNTSLKHGQSGKDGGKVSTSSKSGDGAKKKIPLYSKVNK